MKQLIINADDLGICRSTNEAIGRAHREGVLTSASLMANGPDFEQAIEQVVTPNPRLGVGLHICLTGGRPVSHPDHIPLLVDSQGRLHHGFLSLLRATRRNNKQILRQIQTEIEAQWLRLKAAGVEIDHIDGHRHIHMIPAIFRIVQSLLPMFGSPAVRVSHEPFPLRTRTLLRRSPRTLLSNFPKKVLLSAFARQIGSRPAESSAPECVFGILDSGSLNTLTLHRILRGLRRGVSEIITHPGQPGGPIDPSVSSMDQHFLQSHARADEYAALADPTTREVIEKQHLQLVTYRDLRTKTAPAMSACSASEALTSDDHPDDLAETASNHMDL